MTNESNMFWTIYKKLEKDVIELSYYIHFSDEQSKEKPNQIWTYSNQIADLLIVISTQIESLFLELYKMEFKSSPESIGKGIAKVDDMWSLSQKKIRIISKNMYFKNTNGFGSDFAPMSYKPGDTNDYYSAYCSVKHNRINTLHKANINVLIRALATLFILNVYYSFKVIEIDDISEFDFSLGSDIFMLTSSINSCSADNILLVIEDVEYLEKYSAFMDEMFSLKGNEMLKFEDKASVPQRYIIKINKEKKS